MPQQTPQVIIVQSQKSPGVAAILGFFFGPIGLLYVGLAPALVMFGVNAVLGLLTGGIGLFLTWPVCAVIGWWRAGVYNKNLVAGVTSS